MKIASRRLETEFKKMCVARDRDNEARTAVELAEQGAAAKQENFAEVLGCPRACSG